MNEIDVTIGFNNTLVILSSDHGNSEIPEYMSSLGFQAGRLDARELIARGNASLQKQFSPHRNYINAFWNPGFFLDSKTIADLRLNAESVSSVLASEMNLINGIALAVTREDLMTGNLPDIPELNALRRSFHPKRSGDVLIIQSPFWHLYHDPNVYKAMHGSPYAYDNHVPIFLAGPGIPMGVIFRPVHVESLAATVALFLGISPPSGSNPSTLLEVFGHNR